MKPCVKCLVPQEEDKFPKSRNTCKKCRNKGNKASKDKKREHYKVYNKNKTTEYRKNNSESVKKYRKDYGKIYNELHYKDFYAENREKLIKKGIAYTNKRRQTDPLFKLSTNIRNLIRNAFKRKFTKKSKKTTEILGCSFEQLQEHLQSKFKEGMIWDNYGSYWEIDHIKPIALATSPEELILLNHYTNLQPLTKLENQSKGDSYVDLNI